MQSDLYILQGLSCIYSLQISCSPFVRDKHEWGYFAPNVRKGGLALTWRRAPCNMNHGEWTIEEALKRRNVITRGHFLLSSGRHSEEYMQCARLLQYPTEAEKVGQALAAFFQDREIDVVVGPALGGVIIAYEVARALGVPSLFAEREEGHMRLRRGFTIQPNERVLVIEDVVTTGGSVREVLELLKSYGGEIVGIGAIIDRSGGKVSFDYPFHALLSHSITSYEPEHCPLCQANIPVVKPGSRS